MDFGALPPEINSARMFAGPGSGPMLAAAAAWDGLAAELHATAAGYRSVTSGLASGPWQGPASASMLAAAAPYAGWLDTTAAQAEQAATQARAAAGAYEAARAMTVPPPMIAANRGLLTSLASTNVLGQNTPAIAATEAHYGEMWAQDAAAMYGYAGGSAAASQLRPFTAPPETTNPVGADATRLMSAVPQALQGLALPAQTTLPTFESLSGYAADFGSHLRTTAATLSFIVGAAGLGRAMNVAGGGAVPALGSAAAGAVGSAGLPAVGAAGTMSAGMGRAVSAGALSVPASWAAAAPVTNPVAAGLPSTGSTVGPIVAPAGVPIMPTGGTAGRNAGRLADARFLLRPSMVPRWPVHG